MLHCPVVYRIAIDLLVVVIVSAKYVTANRSWSFFRFLQLQSPTQFQFLLLGLCLLYTCLRCAIILILHHPVLTGIYTYLFSAGNFHEPPSPFRFPGFVMFCCVMSLIYSVRWVKSYLIIQRRVRPSKFFPSKFTRPVEYWILSRRRYHPQREGAAEVSGEQDLEKLLPSPGLESRCESCHFLFDNSYARRSGACIDLVCVIVMMALVDLYLANRNGWVSENMSTLMRLFHDILCWEYCNIVLWFTWIDTIVACLEAQFEWSVADGCRRKRRDAGFVQAKDSPVGS